MFICNLKINSKKLGKIVIIVAIVLALLALGFSIFKIYKESKKETPIADAQTTLEITSENYTTFLKDCHENIDNYVGTNIKIVGYIYRMPDFNENQFVLSRTMLMLDTNTAVVVGILSQSSNANSFQDGDWVSCTGTIIKGDYKGEMPVLEIKSIEKCEVPEGEYVLPPSGFSN